MGDPKAAEVIPACKKEFDRCLASVALWVQILEVRDEKPDQDVKAKEGTWTAPTNATGEKPESQETEQPQQT
jgi:hypothetical protein